MCGQHKIVTISAPGIIVPLKIFRVLKDRNRIRMAAWKYLMDTIFTFYHNLIPQNFVAHHLNAKHQTIYNLFKFKGWWSEEVPIEIYGNKQRNTELQFS